MGKIIVVIPVYRADKFLSRCVNSILQQTFYDFDLFLVDDGSNDRCSEICDQFAKQDSRVYVCHQKNQGPSAARNNGIQFALTISAIEYITFVDSDDVVHQQFLEYLYRSVAAYNADMGMCNHMYINKGGYLQEQQNYSAIEMSEIGPEDLMLNHESGFNYIWGKIYMKKCFESTRFPVDISFGEDNKVIYRIVFSAKKLVYVSNVLYYYFYNPSGVTKSSWSVESLAVIDGIQEQLSFYKNNGYRRAYLKEQEILIQQCAYQIHRIEADKLHYKGNKRYLKALRKEMLKAFIKYPSYHIWDHFYWVEALLPVCMLLRAKTTGMKHFFQKVAVVVHTRRRR